MPAFDEGASQEIPFTVGKIEEGIAVLVTDDLQMVEFPSDYLPKDDKPIGVGSVISLRITHGSSLEIARQQEFVTLQNQILQTFEKAPDAKIIGGCFKEISRAHTSIMAEWPSWKALAETGNWKANLDSLDCEVNGTIVFYGKSTLCF